MEGQRAARTKSLQILPQQLLALPYQRRGRGGGRQRCVNEFPLLFFFNIISSISSLPSRPSAPPSPHNLLPLTINTFICRRLTLILVPFTHSPRLTRMRRVLNVPVVALPKIPNHRKRTVMTPRSPLRRSGVDPQRQRRSDHHLQC